MKSYRAVIPRTGVPYEMVAIPGGEFLMGSPPTEAHRSQDEGPQHKVKIAPFWMGKYEITWDQYEPYMTANRDSRSIGARTDTKLEDAVSGPSETAYEMSFGMGTDGYPAISMTQHAALKFCQWLSAQTGHYYRLPTEAEWEYACRAGTTSAYHFSDNSARLAAFAVFDPIQDRNGYAKVGTKMPNLWGLFDMHGNVLEWCLDQYSETAYEGRKGVTDNPFVRPTKLYPRVVRGGSWYDTADLLRGATRIPSSKDWKAGDPKIPQSLWYLTDATWLGFRIVRPLKIPDAKTMHDIWSQGIRNEE